MAWWNRWFRGREDQVRPAESIRFTARHSDGYTRRQLHYKVSYFDRFADLETDGILPDRIVRGYRTQFALDPELLVRALPHLRVMSPEYHACWTDLDTNELVVESGGETLRWRVYGGGFLVAEKPELLPWLDVWE
jgi:hypothetical protein